MKQIVKNTQYVQESQDLLLYQFKNSPNINELVKIYGEQAQAVENEFYSLGEALDINLASQYALDLIGKEVGELRQSRDDDDYRSAILTRIAINASDGTPESVIRGAQQITNASQIVYSEQYPAQVVLEIIGAEYENRAPAIRKIIPAGVDLVFQKTISMDVANSYAGTAYTQQVMFESNHVYTDLIVGGYLISTGHLSQETVLHRP